MLAQQVPGYVVGLPTGDYGWLAITVCGMGWVSAVGVCQHLHRNVVALAMKIPPQVRMEFGVPLEDLNLREAGKRGGLALEAETCRAAPLPFDARRQQWFSWKIYIDDLIVLELATREEAQFYRASWPR